MQNILCGKCTLQPSNFIEFKKNSQIIFFDRLESVLKNKLIGSDLLIGSAFLLRSSIK